VPQSRHKGSTAPPIAVYWESGGGLWLGSVCSLFFTASTPLTGCQEAHLACKTCATYLSRFFSARRSKKIKVKINVYIAFMQLASLLQELVCNMRSHSVIHHSAEVTIPPLSQSIKVGPRFSDAGGMQGWVDLVGLVTYWGGTSAWSGEVKQKPNQLFLNGN